MANNGKWRLFRDRRRDTAGTLSAISDTYTVSCSLCLVGCCCCVVPTSVQLSKARRGDELSEERAARYTERWMRAGPLCSSYIALLPAFLLAARRAIRMQKLRCKRGVQQSAQKPRRTCSVRGQDLGSGVTSRVWGSHWHRQLRIVIRAARDEDDYGSPGEHTFSAARKARQQQLAHLYAGPVIVRRPPGGQPSYVCAKWAWYCRGDIEDNNE